MVSTMIMVERLSPRFAREFKTARLTALQDAPTAFTGTYAEESQLSAEAWLARATNWSGDRSTCYLAMEDGVPCGLIAGKCDQQDPQRAYVLSMWVAPAYRRSGLGSRLMEAVQSWARGSGVRELHLLVTSKNMTAIHFYRKCGFTPSGLVQPYPNDPALTQSGMVKYLQSED
jgi:ribosomal protein S18 acetylase RimI-like enzyme